MAKSLEISFWTKLKEQIDYPSGRETSHVLGAIISNRILATTRPEDAPENSTDERREKSMLTIFSAMLGSL
jgi:hypothetical protein